MNSVRVFRTYFECPWDLLQIFKIYILPCTTNLLFSVKDHETLQKFESKLLRALLDLPATASEIALYHLVNLDRVNVRAINTAKSLQLQDCLPNEIETHDRELRTGLKTLKMENPPNSYRLKLLILNEKVIRKSEENQVKICTKPAFLMKLKIMKRQIQFQIQKSQTEKAKAREKRANEVGTQGHGLADDDLRQFCRK